MSATEIRHRLVLLRTTRGRATAGAARRPCGGRCGALAGAGESAADRDARLLANLLHDIEVAGIVAGNVEMGWRDVAIRNAQRLIGYRFVDPVQQAIETGDTTWLRERIADEESTVANLSRPPEALTFFQSLLLSPVGDAFSSATIRAGSFFAGATGFNRGEIEEAIETAGARDAANAQAGLEEGEEARRAAEEAARKAKEAAEAAAKKALEAGKKVADAGGNFLGWLWGLIPWWVKLGGGAAGAFMLWTIVGPVIAPVAGAARVAGGAAARALEARRGT